MFNDFGNVNDMTKSQFNTAIEYYRNKIKMLNEDTSISERMSVSSFCEEWASFESVPFKRRHWMTHSARRIEL